MQREEQVFRALEAERQNRFAALQKLQQQSNPAHPLPSPAHPRLPYTHHEGVVGLCQDVLLIGNALGHVLAHDVHLAHDLDGKHVA